MGQVWTLLSLFYRGHWEGLGGGVGLARLRAERDIRPRKGRLVWSPGQGAEGSLSREGRRMDRDWRKRKHHHTQPHPPAMAISSESGPVSHITTSFLLLSPQRDSRGRPLSSRSFARLPAGRAEQRHWSWRGGDTTWAAGLLRGILQVSETRNRKPQPPPFGREAAETQRERKGSTHIPDACPLKVCSHWAPSKTPGRPHLPEPTGDASRAPPPPACPLRARARSRPVGRRRLCRSPPSPSGWWVPRPPAAAGPPGRAPQGRCQGLAVLMQGPHPR